MRAETVAGVVTRLYIAAGRQPPEQVDFEVWAEALEGLDDITALRSAKEWVRTVDADGPPTPARFLQFCDGDQPPHWSEAIS